MEKIRNLSLKKTILFYFVISLTAAFLLSAFTVHFARNMQNEIWEKYIDYADYTDVFQQHGKKYDIEISRPKETNILYGTQDEMIPYKIVKRFSEENNCRLNFVENGQHWLHTDREVAAMRKWEQTVLEESRSIIPNK